MNLLLTQYITSDRANGNRGKLSPMCVRLSECARRRRIPRIDSDSICVTQTANGNRFESVGLYMRPSDRNPVPVNVKEVGFALSAGSWEKENDGTFDDFSVMPTNDGAVLVCRNLTDFKTAVDASLDEHNGYSNLRISVLGRNDLREVNHFSFFDFHGFRQAMAGIGSISRRQLPAA